MMVETAYQGEAMLLRWGDNNSSGRTVTFQIEEDAPIHPFKGFPSGAKNGQRFMLAVVPINDEQLPDEDTAQKVRRKHFDEMPRSQQAGILCAEPVFQRFLHVESAEEAAEQVRSICGVNSRRALDNDPAAAAQWDAISTDFKVHSGRMAEQR